jgi:hypothetical protein
MKLLWCLTTFMTAIIAFSPMRLRSGQFLIASLCLSNQKLIADERVVGECGHHPGSKVFVASRNSNPAVNVGKAQSVHWPENGGSSFILATIGIGIIFDNMRQLVSLGLLLM